MSFSPLSQYVAIFVVLPTIAVFGLLFTLTASAYWSDSTRRYLNGTIFELAQTKPDIGDLDTKSLARLNEVYKAANNDERDDLPARDRALASSAGRSNDLSFLWKLVVRRSELTDRALTSMERHCTTAVSARNLLRASNRWYYIEFLRIVWRGVIEQTQLTGKRILRRAVETTGTGGAVGLTMGAAFWLLAPTTVPAGETIGTRHPLFYVYIGYGVTLGAFLGVVWTATERFIEIAPTLFGSAATGSKRSKWGIGLSLAFCVALGPLLYYRPWEYSPRLVHWLGNHLPHGRQVGVALVMLASLLYLLRRVYLVFRASLLLRNLPSSERLELLTTAVFGLAMVAALASVMPFVVSHPPSATHSSHTTSAVPSNATGHVIPRWAGVVVIITIFTASLIWLLSRVARFFGSSRRNRKYAKPNWARRLKVFMHVRKLERRTEVEALQREKFPVRVQRMPCKAVAALCLVLGLVGIAIATYVLALPLQIIFLPWLPSALAYGLSQVTVFIGSIPIWLGVSVYAVLRQFRHQRAIDRVYREEYQKAI